MVPLSWRFSLLAPFGYTYGYPKVNGAGNGGMRPVAGTKVNRVLSEEEEVMTS